jgi:hypothetical protein
VPRSGGLKERTPRPAPRPGLIRRRSQRTAQLGDGGGLLGGGGEFLGHAGIGANNTGNTATATDTASGSGPGTGMVVTSAQAGVNSSNTSKLQVTASNGSTVTAP